MILRTQVSVMKSSLPGGGAERRESVRHPCNPAAVGWVTDVLEQQRQEAGAWNLSDGGACLVLGAHFGVGNRLAMELHQPALPEGLFAWAQVEHTICCPSFNDMWLTGCSFLDRPSPENPDDPAA